MAITEPRAHPNGVNIEAIREARRLMTEQPDLAAFQFRARSRWIDGVQTRTTFDTYYGAGGEQAHKQPYTYDADHPELFAAPDEGPTPVEFVLHALTSCITAGIASVAANQGIALASVTATAEGDMDLRGVLGVDGGVRNGYSGITLRFSVAGDAPAERLAWLVAQGTRRSAVYDVVTSPIPVTIEVDAG